MDAQLAHGRGLLLLAGQKPGCAGEQRNAAMGPVRKGHLPVGYGAAEYAQMGSYFSLADALWIRALTSSPSSLCRRARRRTAACLISSVDLVSWKS